MAGRQRHTMKLKYLSNHLNHYTAQDAYRKPGIDVFLLYPKELTHTDSGQYSQALLFYHKELDPWKENPKDECETWSNIAKLNVCSRKRFKNSFRCLWKGLKQTIQRDTWKSILKYSRSKDACTQSPYRLWHVTIEQAKGGTCICDWVNETKTYNIR